MNFWATTKATPSWWQISGCIALKPDFIRREMPVVMKCEWKIKRIGGVHTQAIMTFMEQHYGGEQWNMKRMHEWISHYFHERILILGAFDKDKLIATIFSVPFTQGNTYMSHQAILSNVRVIEGLCVHRSYRGKGLAGYMIQYMDFMTHHMFGPTVHLWSKEEPYAYWFSSALCSDKYAYIHCEEANRFMDIHRMDFKAFAKVWNVSSRFWLVDHQPCIVAEIASPIRSYDIDVWIGQEGSTTYVAVVNNTRREYQTSKFYEVSWCGKMADGRLDPCHVSPAFLTSVASNYKNAMVFATDRHCHTWAAPWIYGTSGVHTTYMYNYIPPSFGSCAIYAIRDEF